MKDVIKIRGARVNNLKNIDLDIPLNKITCFFGVSGSGKTSIAFHTLFTESKRRFLNSFPTYLKFFSDRPSPVDVDEIHPVLPVFGLPQTNPVVGARSNVSDVMHLTELLQSAFYNFSKQYCPKHMQEFEKVRIDDEIMSLTSSVSESEPIYILIKREQFLDNFKQSPLPSRSLNDLSFKEMREFNSEDAFWEVARFKRKNTKSLLKKLDPYIKKDISLYLFSTSLDNCVQVFFDKNKLKCAVSNCLESSIQNYSAMNFSPYNAVGACDECGGFGENLDYDLEKLVDINKSVNDGGVLLLRYKRFADQIDYLKKELKRKKISINKPISELGDKFWDILYKGVGYYEGFDAFFRYFDRKKYKMHVRIFVRNLQKSIPCKSCGGSRLNLSVKNFYLDNDQETNLINISKMSIFEMCNYINDLEGKLVNSTKESRKAVRKIKSILETALGIGLGHLELSRKAKSLSAGEYQRLLLIKYLSYEGTSSLFVFDEPSLGLSRGELTELFKGFQKIIKQKNTIVIIDHNKFIQKKSDYLIEMGPGAGLRGGEVLYKGDAKSYKMKSLNFDFDETVPELPKKFIKIEKPHIYGKKYKNFKVQVNAINLVNGPSGSGKTSCLVNTLATKLYYDLKSENLSIPRGSYKSIEYDHEFNDVIIVDANLNRYTSRSSVGSMTELFTVVRKHFSKKPVAKSMNLVDGHFSYNSELGQCPKCEGKGVEVVEMQFLEDIVLTCEDCKGKRLKPLYAEFSDGNMTVHEAFSNPIGEVLKNIKLTPKFQRVFEYLKILNLDYLSLNRSINSLSGGEKQRIYLLNKLLKNLDNSILFFENVSFGLSDNELIKICKFFQDLSLKGNTLVIIDQDEIFKKISNNTIVFS